MIWFLRRGIDAIYWRWLCMWTEARVQFCVDVFSQRNRTSNPPAHQPVRVAAITEPTHPSNFWTAAFREFRSYSDRARMGRLKKSCCKIRPGTPKYAPRGRRIGNPAVVPGVFCWKFLFQYLVRNDWPVPQAAPPADADNTE